MTKDVYRKYQKQLCYRTWGTKNGVYGCYCCRKISNLNLFKKFARNRAKHKLRLETKNEIAEEKFRSIE